MRRKFHARCGAGEKSEVETPEIYLSLLKENKYFHILSVLQEAIVSPFNQELPTLIVLKGSKNYSDGKPLISQTNFKTFLSYEFLQ